MRVGIVGTGAAGWTAAEALRRAREVTSTPLELVAGADTSAEARAAFEQQHGVPTVASVEELLQRPDVDTVFVATPTSFHAPLALAAVRAGRHVMVEKPIALTLEDADRRRRSTTMRVIGCADDEW